MQYEKIYNNLIDTRKDRTLDPNNIYETHHIIPRSMGGSNEKENLVKLTPREHFIAHLLLYQIHKNRQTAFALIMMTGTNHRCRKRDRKISARQYEEIKKNVSVHMSEYMKTKYANGYTWMKGKKFTEKHLENLRKGMHDHYDNMSPEEHAEFCKLRKKGAEQKRINGTVYTNRGAIKVNKMLHKCPHCGQEGKGNIFKRWHFDYCPENPNAKFDPTREKFKTLQTDVNKVKYTCPHCKSEGMGPGFKKWHFENCRTIGGTPKVGVMTEEGRKRQKEGVAKANVVVYTCPICGKSGKGNGFKGHHFSKCKKSELMDSL